MEKQDATDLRPETYPMNGGDGRFSYSRNSYMQGAAANIANQIVYKEIAEKLNLEEFSPTPSSFSIADLGCSVGPNTFNAVQNIIDAVCCKYNSQGLGSRIPSFQVFFNDFASNDFNTLFASLPADRQYYAAGVPGSFYAHLFPDSSLHFVHSSYSIQWLSKVPEPLIDRSSAAWNKGRIHYASAPAEVGAAYASQFAKDVGVFLSARGKEIVSGGIMVLMMLGNRDGVPNSEVPWGFMFEFAGFSLMDMVKEGKIREAEVDSFNLPIYAASPKEMTELVEANGCFSILRIELKAPRLNPQEPLNGEAWTLHIRAGMEGIFSKHFGSKIVDELFDRYQKKTEELASMLYSGMREATQLLVILKRK